MKKAIVLMMLVSSWFGAKAQCAGFEKYPKGAEEAKKKHVIYKAYIDEVKLIEKELAKHPAQVELEKLQAQKQEKYKEGFEVWKELYQYCAGATEWHPYHGIEFFTYFAEQETDSLLKKAHQTEVLKLYDDYVRCFGKTGEKKGELLRKKATYMLYEAKELDSLVFLAFDASLAATGTKTPYSLFKPFLYVAVNEFKRGAVSKEKMRKIHDDLLFIADTNALKTTDERVKAKYVEARNEVLVQFEPIRFEVFDCAYFVEKYTSVFKEHYNDVVFLEKEVLFSLKRAGCTADEPLVKDIIVRLANHRDSTVLANRTPSMEAAMCYKQGNYPCAIEKFEEAITREATTSEQKADFAYAAAQIAFANLKDFSKARLYARKAIEHRPNWGKPYLMIGDLYASSGPLCGSGRGFESQRVVWVAMDMWQKAKQVDNDPEVVAAANKQIANYTQYMPDKEQIHERNLQEGQSYFVPCWIQEQTTVRAYNRFK